MKFQGLSDKAVGRIAKSIQGQEEPNNAVMPDMEGLQDEWDNDPGITKSIYKLLGDDDDEWDDAVGAIEESGMGAVSKLKEWFGDWIYGDEDKEIMNWELLVKKIYSDME